MNRLTLTLRRPTALVLLACLLVLSGCLPVVAVRELTYRPSPKDEYGLWRAYVTDSGLLLFCGSVDNGRESMERVERSYNLALRLEETLEPPRPDGLQVIQIDDHPTLERIKGYTSDLCQFERKRATMRPDETGWTKVMLDNWDEGYAKITMADIQAGRLPIPPAEPRVVIHQVRDSDPPAYLLMGRLREGGPEARALLVLGSEHIKRMW